MIIKVNKLYTCENERIIVEFSTQYGSAKGLWQGNIPEPNQSYHVEIDARKILLWGIDIVSSECKDYKIWSTKDKVNLNVKLESYEEGCLAVRLGNSIILLETEGVPYSDFNFLKLQLDTISIYPYDL